MAEKGERRRQPEKRPKRHNTNRGLALPRVMKFVEPNSDNWREQAACKGMDVRLFFPESGGNGINTAKQAKKVCATCPVTGPCLEYGLRTSDREGIYGGLSHKQRSVIKRTLR